MSARDAWRRTLQRNRRRLPMLVVLGLIAVFACVRLLQTRSQPADSVFDSKKPFRVKRVVDGDTLLLDGGTRVRLIGVDTPETKHPNRPVEPLGREAAKFVRRHVQVIGDRRRQLQHAFDRLNPLAAVGNAKLVHQKHAVQRIDPRSRSSFCSSGVAWASCGR